MRRKLLDFSNRIEGKEIFDDYILTIVNKKLAKKDEGEEDLDLVPEEETILVKSIEKYLIDRFSKLLHVATDKEFCSFDNLTIRNFSEHKKLKYYRSKFLICRESVENYEKTPIPLIFAFHIRPVNKFQKDINIKLELTQLKPESILVSGYREFRLKKYKNIYSDFVPGWKTPKDFFSDNSIPQLGVWINLKIKRIRNSIQEYIKFSEDILEERNPFIIEMLKDMYNDYCDMEDIKMYDKQCELIVYNAR